MNNIIKKIALCILMLMFIISICPIDMQNDTFYDIVIGKEYTENGMFTMDKFSVHENLSYQTHHFFVDIIIYNIYNMYNLIGLHIFEIILSSTIAILFYLLNNQFIKSRKMSFCMTFIEMFMFTGFISLRAQMFSTIIFLIEMLLINKYLYAKTSKVTDNIILSILTLIPTLLINLHSGVIIFYYIIIVVYLLNFFKVNLIRIENDKNIDRKKLVKLIYPLIISLPLLLLNPYGIDGITYMFKTLNNSYINSNIQEFSPFNIKNQIGTYMALYFTIFIMALIFSNKKIKVQEILFLSGTLFMSLLSVRHFIFFIITTVVLLSHLQFVLIRMKDWLFNGLTKKGSKSISITIDVVMILIVISTNCKILEHKQYDFIPDKIYPVNAVKYLENNIGSDKVIFNEYRWGSYMMLNNIKVFIDSRCDLYTEEYNRGVTVAEDYMKTLNCTVNYEDTVSKYGIQYFLIIKDVPLAIMLLKDSNYEKIYEDDISYIIKKK